MSTAAILTRDAIMRAVNRTPRETVEIPEWAGTLEVRTMSAADHDVYIDLVRGLGPSPGLARCGAALLVACVYDPATNARVFVPADVDGLVEHDHLVIGRLVSVAMRLNKIDAPTEGAS